MALILALVYVYTDWLAPLKSKSTDIAAPFYWMTDFPDRVEIWADNRVMSRETLVQENESLRSEVLVLRRKVQQTASLAAENIRLRRLLNSAETLEDRVLVAELIGVSPDPNQHIVMVNRGLNHGVYVGQALLDASGLMGQVIEVGQQNAKVLLITDVTHAIPVQVNRNGVRLIAEGIGDLYQLALPHISSTMDIKEGDLLVSSGLGQRFPVGYPVAKVTKVKFDRGKPFAQIYAQPMAELNRSRHVLLVFDKPPAEGS